jgi:general secretion pathway protein N
MPRSFRSSRFDASGFGTSTFGASPVRKHARGSGTPVSATHSAWAWLGAAMGALGALLVFAPAAWLAQGVASASKGQVLLADARGSVWRGSAQLVLTGGANSTDATALPERVQWTLWPSMAGLRGDVLPVCCSAQPAQVLASPHWGGARLDVSALQMNLPAELLAGLGTPWNTLNAQGQLALTANTLSVDWAQGRAQLDGNATLDMTGVSSRLSTLRPLGDYRLSLNGGPVPTVQLQTLQGALQLSGTGQWVGSRMRFTGEASATPDREDALSNLLNIIGRRQGAKSLITLG